MKKYSALVLALAVSVNVGAFTRVQICNATYPGGCGITFSCNGTTAGNTLIVCIKTNGAGGPPTVSDGVNSYTLANSGAKNTNGGGAYCYYAQNIFGGNLTITPTCNGANFIGDQAVEYSGVGPYDVGTDTAPTNATTTITSNAFTTTDTDLIFAFWGNQTNAGPFTAAGTNFTAVSHQDSSYQASEEWIGATAGSHTASMVLTSGGNANAMTVLSFKPPPVVPNSPAAVYMSEF